MCSGTVLKNVVKNEKTNPSPVESKTIVHKITRSPPIICAQPLRFPFPRPFPTSPPRPQHQHPTHHITQLRARLTRAHAGTRLIR